MAIYKVALQGSGFVNWLNFNQPMTFNEDLVLTQVYETLFYKNELGTIEKNLVLNFKVENNQLIIKLRKRHFHDGKKLLANDVINSLKQSLNSPYKHNNNGWTEDFVKLKSNDLHIMNASEFSIKLRHFKLNDVLEELCKVKHSIKKGVIGTGPYFVDQVYSEDQKVILKQNNVHPKHKQCVDEVHLIGYKNNFETLRAFLNKEVDQVRVWGLKSPFKYNPNTLMVPSKTFYTSYFQFNTKSKTFESQTKRLKFRTAFLSNIMLHKEYPWNAFTGVIPSETFDSPKHAIKTKLPLVIHLGVAHKRQKKEVERLINKQHFKDMGYKIKIINYESYEKLYSSMADLIYTAFSYEQNNRHKLPEIFHSIHKKNKTGHQNEKLDQFIEQKNYQDAEEYIWSKALIIPLGWFQCHILTHKDSSIFCGIKNNKVTPVLYKSKLQDFIQLFSSSQKELFKLREKNWSHLSQKSKVDEIIDQFSHDIKSPLSILSLMIKNYAYSAEGYNRVLGRIEEFNDDIKKEIHHAFNDTQDIYDETEDLNQLIKDICIEKRMEYKQLPKFKINFSTSGSPIKCPISPIKLKRILSNLVNNAVESRDKWNHKVNIELQSKDDLLSIIIQDNGKGFSESQLIKVLDNKKITNKKNGQGLGLYNAKKTIESLGGELAITSQSFQFTEVKILLKNESHQIKKATV